MSGEKTSRRSGRRRRRRRPRNPQGTNQQKQQAASMGKKAGPGKKRRARQEHDKLPDVFIYTYTIYKSGD